MLEGDAPAVPCVQAATHACRLQPYVSQAIHQLLEGGAHVNAADTSGVLPIGFAAHKALPCMRL